MQSLEINMQTPPNFGGLTAALQLAVPALVFGVSGYGAARPITVWLDDAATPANKNTLTNTANAHDPVFLSADKTQVAADGSDLATINVSAPKPGAAGVTLVCTKPDGTTITEAVVLTNGAGTISFKTVIAGAYVITVQNPANRSADALTITGV